MKIKSMSLVLLFLFIASPIMGETMKVTITGYSPGCKKQGTGWRTATGRHASHPGIAVDPKVIPLGSKVKIGNHWYLADDTGGRIKGKRIDLRFTSRGKAIDWGRKHLTVTIKRKSVNNNTKQNTDIEKFVNILYGDYWMIGMLKEEKMKEVDKNKARLYGDRLYSDIMRKPPTFHLDLVNKYTKKNKGTRKVIRQSLYLPPEMWSWVNINAEEMNVPPGHVVESIIIDFRNNNRSIMDVLSNIKEE